MGPGACRAVRPVLAWCVITLCFLNPMAGAAGGGAVADIGSRLELFVDRYLIQQLKGARLHLHHPEPAEVVLVYDRPWEGIYSGAPRVIRDGQRYHMYYHGFPEWKDGEQTEESTCYAVSQDGIRWSRPELGLYERKGTRRNNVIFDSGGFAPFLDSRPGVPASERLKALKSPPRLKPEEGVMAYASGDGIHWKRLREDPVILENLESEYGPVGAGAAFWSPVENFYVHYTRCNLRSPKGKLVRSIQKSTSPDFLHWSRHRPMSFGGAGPIPGQDFYTFGTQPYFRAPHIHIALIPRFMQGRRVLSDEEGRTLEPGGHGGRWDDCSDVVFMTSRGGYVYDRTFREGFIRPGLGRRNWLSRTNFPGVGTVPTGSGEMSLYVARDYGLSTHHIRRYTLRTDGFVSVHSPYAGSEMVTKAFKFRGRELVLNGSTSAAGSIRVEIQDERGEAVPGFSLPECTAIVGDRIEQVVRWKAGSSLAEIAGEPIRIRFRMRDADLYSIRFR